MKNVVITGAAGFIGQAAIKTFVDKGIRVWAVVSEKDMDKLTAVTSPYMVPVISSLDSVDEIVRILEKSEADTVYHLAWHWHGARNSDYILQNANISTCLKVCEACAKSGCKRIIMPGSAAEYAYSGRIIDGHGEPAPGNAYSAAKAAAHIVCAQYAREHDLELIWLLISSVYGPGRDDSNIITYAITSLIKGEYCSFTGLEQKWDYIYIDDLADCLYLIGENGIGGKVYPVGSGSNDALAQYIYKIRDLIDPRALLGIGDKPYLGGKIPDNQVLDIMETCKDTGFEPKIPFETGIAETIRYFRNR